MLTSNRRLLAFALGGAAALGFVVGAVTPAPLPPLGTEPAQEQRAATPDGQPSPSATPDVGTGTDLSSRDLGVDEAQQNAPRRSNGAPPASREPEPNQPGSPSGEPDASESPPEPSPEPSASEEPTPTEDPTTPAPDPSTSESSGGGTSSGQQDGGAPAAQG